MLPNVASLPGTYCTSLPQVHVVTCTYLIQSLSPKERQRLIQGQQTLLHYGSLLITSSAYTSYLAPMADHCKLPHLGIVFDTCSIQVYLVSYKCRGQKPIRLQVEHYLPGSRSSMPCVSHLRTHNRLLGAHYTDRDSNSLHALIDLSQRMPCDCDQVTRSQQPHC